MFTQRNDRLAVLLREIGNQVVMCAVNLVMPIDAFTRERCCDAQVRRTGSVERALDQRGPFRLVCARGANKQKVPTLK